MVKIKIVNSYVDAILGLLGDNIDDFYSECVQWREIIKKNPLLIDFLENVVIDNITKKQLLDGLFSFAKVSLQFLFFIIDENKGVYWRFIIDMFIKKYNKKKNIADVKVISTMALDEKNIGKIKEFVKNKFTFNVVKISNVINKEIIGGIIIFVNNIKIDFSIKTKINRILYNKNLI